MDADQRARLIAQGIDPEAHAAAEALKPQPLTAAAPQPSLADHLTALANLIAQNPTSPTDSASVSAAYRPIEQVYAAPEQPAAPQEAQLAAPAAPEVAESAAVVPGGATALSLFEETPAPEPVVPVNEIYAAPEAPVVAEALTVADEEDPELVALYKSSTPSPMSIQVGGDHYSKLAFQPLDFILANKIGFVEGNIIKYVVRWQDKGGVSDLQKAQDYLTKLIAHVEAQAASSS